MKRGASYLAEFVVVFLGVSLSFFAENVREERAERAMERASLERLVRDMDQDLADFPGNLQRLEAGMAAIDRLLEARDDPAPSPDSVSADLSDFLQCSIMVANTSEYESLKASGGLNRIQDADFRQRLTENYEMYPDLKAWHRADCTRMEEILEYVADELRIGVVGTDWDVRVVGPVERVTGDRRFQAALASLKAERGVLAGFISDRIEMVGRLRARALELLSR